MPIQIKTNTNYKDRLKRARGRHTQMRTLENFLAYTKKINLRQVRWVYYLSSTEMHVLPFALLE